MKNFLNINARNSKIYYGQDALLSVVHSDLSYSKDKFLRFIVEWRQKKILENEKLVNEDLKWITASVYFYFLKNLFWDF